MTYATRERGGTGGSQRGFRMKKPATDFILDSDIEARLGAMSGRMTKSTLRLVRGYIESLTTPRIDSPPKENRRVILLMVKILEKPLGRGHDEGTMGILEKYFGPCRETESLWKPWQLARYIRNLGTTTSSSEMMLSTEDRCALPTAIMELYHMAEFLGMAGKKRERA